MFKKIALKTAKRMKLKHPKSISSLKVVINMVCFSSSFSSWSPNFASTNGATSAMEELNFLVPQGSFLRPLLLIICIKKFLFGLKSCQVNRKGNGTIASLLLQRVSMT